MKSFSLSAFLSTMRCQTGRAMVWLPWLAMALLIAAVLSPGTVVASRLVFQSPPSPLPEPTPVSPTPVPPTLLPPSPSATQAPASEQPTPSPTQAAPAQTPPAEGTPPAQATPPVQGTPPAEGTPSPTVRATRQPVSSPQPTPRPRETKTPTPSPETGEPTINWVKFWDTLVVWLAYPWLCCGVGLLLLVPVFLLYLEIKGRRRPPLPPELPPEEADEEFGADEGFNE